MSEALQQEIRHLRALEGSPRDPDGRVFLPLADAHLRSGDFVEAERLLADGLARHPEFVAAHVLAARVHLSRGDEDGAEMAYAAARRLDPENVEVLHGLGSILAGRGEEIGVMLVEKARAMDPTVAAVAKATGSPVVADMGVDAAADVEAEIVSIADLAPDSGIVSIAELAPDFAAAEVVSIADLAPGDPAEDVPAITALAPDEVAHPDEGPGLHDASTPEDAPEPEDTMSLEVDDVDAAKDVDVAVDGSDTEPEVDEPSAGETDVAEGTPDADLPPPPATATPPVRANGQGGLATKTLAELLVAQGQTAQAIEMYERLVAARPDDQGLTERLAELRSDERTDGVDHAAPDADRADADDETRIGDYLGGLLGYTPSDREPGA